MGAGIINHYSKDELKAADEAQAAAEAEGDNHDAEHNGDATALKEKTSESSDGKINNGYHTAESDDTRM